MIGQLTLFSSYLYEKGWLDLDGSTHPSLSETQVFQSEKAKQKKEAEIEAAEQIPSKEASDDRKAGRRGVAGRGV